MAATVKGLSGVVFGCSTVSGVVMQSDDADAQGQIAYLNDEDGDTAAFAMYQMDRVAITGEYKFEGNDIVATLGSLITGITLPGGLSGGVYVYQMSRNKRGGSSPDFQAGRFTGAGVDGIA